MARTISAKAQVTRVRFLILRSLYYNQGLPKKLLLQDLSKPTVAAEITAMLELKLIRKGPTGALQITDLGRENLLKMAGNRKPPMIDIDPSMLLAKERRKQFTVRSSLAAEIFREVRHGE